MSDGKILRLEMSYKTSNETIDCFNNLCCSWGQIKTPKDSSGNIRGKNKISAFTLVNLSLQANT